MPCFFTALKCYVMNDKPQINKRKLGRTATLTAIAQGHMAVDNQKAAVEALALRDYLLTNGHNAPIPVHPRNQRQIRKRKKLVHQY
jgi:hypothetical protein